MFGVKQWYPDEHINVLLRSLGRSDKHTNVLLRTYLMNIPMFYFENTWWTYQCFTSGIPDEHTNVLLRAYLMNIPMFYFGHTNIVMFIRYAPSKTLVCSSGTLEVKHWYVYQIYPMIVVKHWYVHQVIPMFYFDHTWWAYQCFTSGIPDEHTNVLPRAYLMNIPMFYFGHTWW
jgi:hypothetical protein